MFISSVVLYLVVRKAQKETMSDTLINIGMFSVPAVFFFLVCLNDGTVFSLTPQLFLVIVISSFFFSFLSSKFSIIGIHNAPNPGYSLIISKSYVVFTTIVSLFLFQSSLTLKSAIGILFIVLFSGLVVIGKKNKHMSHSKKWVLYSLGAFFGWGALALANKYFITAGIPIPTFLFYINAIVFLLFITEWKRNEKKPMITGSMIPFLILIGISTTGLNYFMQLGFEYAPNIGYVNAINASSIAIVTLLSAYFFKDELTIRKIVGVVGVIGGMILLFI